MIDLLFTSITRPSDGTLRTVNIPKMKYNLVETMNYVGLCSCILPYPINKTNRSNLGSVRDDFGFV